MISWAVPKIEINKYRIEFGDDVQGNINQKNII